MFVWPSFGEKLDVVLNFVSVCKSMFMNKMVEQVARCKSEPAIKERRDSYFRRL